MKKIYYFQERQYVLLCFYVYSLFKFLDNDSKQSSTAENAGKKNLNIFLIKSGKMILTLCVINYYFLCSRKDILSEL